MAEFGILVWRSGSSTPIQNAFPDEYDLILNLDMRIEPKAKSSKSVMKFTNNEGILKSPGNIVYPNFSSTVLTHKTTGPTKKPKSDIIQPTFIDKCIARISEKTKQEELALAVERVKYDPRYQEILYRKLNLGMMGLWLTQCEIIAKKYVLQTIYVDRISCCKKRVHLEGIERVLSQEIVLNLLECKLGKVYKSSAFHPLSESVGSSEIVCFTLEFPPHKLTLTPIEMGGHTSIKSRFESILDIEATNAARRTNRHLTSSNTDNYKNYFADLDEEIQTIVKSQSINTPIKPFGRGSKYIEGLNIVAWKINNEASAKGILHTVKNWSDLTRLPLRVRGIFSVLYAPISKHFETLSSVNSLKMLHSIENIQDAFWVQWLGEIKYRNEKVVETLLNYAYNGVEKGCEMEQVIMLTYFETVCFLYNVVGRLSGVRVREILYHGIFHKSSDNWSKWTEEQRKQVKKMRRLDCDEYLSKNFLFLGLTGQLLLDIRACMSIPCSMIYILRYAYGLNRIQLDADEVESDMNLVIMGYKDLEQFLEYYVPPLSRLASKANMISVETSYGEILELLFAYDILIIFLSLFSEIQCECHVTCGYLFAKRFSSDMYLLTHVDPRINHVGNVAGFRLEDILLHVMESITCTEFDREYNDRFEGYDNGVRNAAWQEYMTKKKEDFALEKLKYGDRGEEWEEKQNRLLLVEKQQADARYTLKNLVKELYSDIIWDKRSRGLKIIKKTAIHHLRINYVYMNMFLGTQCHGVTDIATVVFPVAAPHKSLMVITVYSAHMPITDVLASIARRFRKNFENIYQHVLVGIGPSEVFYDTSIDDLKTKDRVVYRGIGPMRVKHFPYLSEGIDGQAIIVKSDDVKRGSKFFFVKVAGAD
ncbi:VP2 [CHeRI orbivirus 1]|nr:VP2 [CHeRI orbivirus 1]